MVNAFYNCIIGFQDIFYLLINLPHISMKPFHAAANLRKLCACMLNHLIFRTSCRHNMVHGIFRRISISFQFFHNSPDPLRQASCFVCKYPDFLRDYGKSPPGIPSPGAFNRRVQRQQVRLAGYGKNLFCNFFDRFCIRNQA